MAATVIGALIAAFAVRGVISKAIILLWLTAVLLVSWVRILLVRHYPRQATSYQGTRQWQQWNLITLGLSGSVWGAASWLLFPAASLPHQFFLLVLLCGILAGSVLAFSIRTSAFLAFSVSIVLPLCLRLLTLHAEVHVTMGISALLFWFLSYFMARNFKRTRLQLMELKEDLADRVARRTADLETANRLLREENEQRMQMEERLRQEKSHWKRSPAIWAPDWPSFQVTSAFCGPTGY